MKLLVVLSLITCSTATHTCNLTRAEGTRSFLEQIFLDYGTADRAHITVRNFTWLMHNISLGRVIVTCQDGDEVCRKQGVNNHLKLVEEGRHEHGDEHKRKRREVSNQEDVDDIETHHKHFTEHLSECLAPGKLLEKHGLSANSSLSREDFLRVCPALVQQLDSKKCVHEHIKILGHFHGNDEKPTTYESWGYGLLSITVISLLSLSVISVIPCLKKSYYHVIMAYLVSLAVGTLAGDAMLHLIPHAFAEGANTALKLRISEEDKLKQHFSQVWRALFVLIGIYLFFCVEQLMKAKVLCCGKGHGHSHGGHTQSNGISKEKRASSIPDAQNQVVLVKKSEDAEEMKTFVGDHQEKQKEGEPALHAVLSCESNMHSIADEEHRAGAHFHADDRHHHHHHGEKGISKDTDIAAVAWMVIVGDGFHNFSDGLAVGAAFSASLSSGLSTAIAVFCHELPHELGDFAVLINSGMTVKQAIVYNIVSAVLAYLGLAVGIFVGEYEEGRHFILSITAGLFLYVSLADMLPELMHQEIPNQSLCLTFLCQHMGILSGIGMMLLISIYEHSM